ncbi:MAG: HD domain-containing protein, partial [Myxococcales bacterium]
KREQLERGNDQLQQYAADLNQTISQLRESEKRLEESHLDTIHRLVLAAEFKDEDTGDHIIRMSHYSALLAEKLGFDAKQVKILLYAAPMHDIGKIGIPDSILMKRGKLTDSEFETIQSHTRIGARILSGSSSELLQAAERIALTHHEKWNGTGYPNKLQGTHIPIFGRIVALADVFDALTSRRPYKEPFPVNVAVDIITLDSDRRFDSNLVNLFLENLGEFIKIKKESEPPNRSRVGSS